MIEEFELEDRIYFVTKLELGGDLTKFCMQYQKLNDEAAKTGWLSEAQARHIFCQLALGVCDLHRKGIVHRDLKLCNVFLSDETDLPRVKIGDLGLAA